MFSEVFIMAEVGQAHDGSIGIMHSYIDAVAQTGVDAIKFQTHVAEAESSLHEPFRIKFSYEDETRYDYWKRMSFSFSQWQEVKSHCDEVGLEFVSSPFSVAAVELLEKVGVRRYKVGSGEVTNSLMLDVMASTGKEVILSTGLSSFSEIDSAIERIRRKGSKVSIMQCTTAYPTAPADVGLNVIAEYRARYQVPVGLSDHSGSIFPSLAAVSVGADLVEVHVVFDRRMFGPDSSSSLTIDELKTLAQGIREISVMRTHIIDKNDNGKFERLKHIFEKSLAVNKALGRGAVIKIEDLESKKPGRMGIPASQYEQVIGRVLAKNKNQWDFINEEDFVEQDKSLRSNC